MRVWDLIFSCKMKLHYGRSAETSPRDKQMMTQTASNSTENCNNIKKNCSVKYLMYDYSENSFVATNIQFKKLPQLISTGIYWQQKNTKWNEVNLSFYFCNCTYFNDLQSNQKKFNFTKKIFFRENRWIWKFDGLGAVISLRTLSVSYIPFN